MSPLTVISLSEVLENMEVWHGVVVVREAGHELIVTMEVGHELLVTIVVTYKEVVIVVVGKVYTNKKQWKECEFIIFKGDQELQNSCMYIQV